MSICTTISPYANRRLLGMPHCFVYSPPSQTEASSALLFSARTGDLLSFSDYGTSALIDALSSGNTIGDAIGDLAAECETSPEHLADLAAPFIQTLDRIQVLSSATMEAEPPEIPSFHGAASNLGTLPGKMLTHVLDTNMSHLPSPVGLRFALTSRCSLYCRHCYLGPDRRSQAVDLSESAVQSVVTRVAEYGLAYTELSGGEPLLHPYAFDIAESVLARGIPLLVITSGMGFCLDTARERIWSLPNRDISQFQVSIDAATQAAHSACRPGSSLQQILRFTADLREAGCRVSSNTVISTNNLRSLDDIVSRLIDAGICEMNISICSPVGENPERTLPDCPSLQDYLALHESFQEIKEHIPCGIMATFHLPHLPYLANSSIDATYPVQGTIGRNICAAGVIDAAITSDGCIAPCAQLGVFSDFRGGSIYEDDFLELWTSSPELNAVRNVACGGHCMSCKYANSCPRGCHALKRTFGMDLGSPDVYCAYNPEKDEIDHKIGNFKIPSIRM